MTVAPPRPGPSQSCIVQDEALLPMVGRGDSKGKMKGSMFFHRDGEMGGHEGGATSVREKKREEKSGKK